MNLLVDRIVGKHDSRVRLDEFQAQVAGSLVVIAHLLDLGAILRGDDSLVGRDVLKACEGFRDRIHQGSSKRCQEQKGRRHCPVTPKRG